MHNIDRIPGCRCLEYDLTRSYDQYIVYIRAKLTRQLIYKLDEKRGVFAVVTADVAFEIGFVVFVPFIVLDLVVANILLALGMFMLSPTIISLPFKLLIFIAVDGWALIVQGLVQSYN